MSRQLLFLACTMVVGAAAQEGAIVEGVVTNSVTGEPVGKATVTLSGKPERTVTAGADGRFRFDGLAPGVFHFRAEREGFSSPLSLRSLVMVGRNETKRGVMVLLDPQAVVAGRVFDENGEPVRDARITLYRSDRFGRGMGWHSAERAESDDRGAYRVHSIDPGRYRAIVAKTPRRGSSECAIAMAEFPETSGPAARQTAWIGPGEDKRLDFHLKPASDHVIRGRVVGLPGELRFARVRLCTRGGVPLPDFEVMAGADQHEFTFRGMPPGEYLVSAASFTDNRGQRGAVQSVDTRRGSVEGLSLELRGGAPVSGVIRLPDSMTGSGLRVALDSGVEFGPAPPSPAPIGKDGSFRFPEVLPGIWTVEVIGLPRDAYIRSVSDGERESPSRELDLRNGSTEPVAVAVGIATGKIEGRVVGLPEGAIAMVHAFSTGRGRMFPLLGPIFPNGVFSLGGVAPGEYRLAALLLEDNLRAQDTETRRGLENRLPLVKIGEGSAVVQNVPFISSDDLDRAERAAP